ncbi:translation initiation factor 2 [Streptomyces sp. NBC_01618]|uniref:translation initiation factor 2 n=1 Tax=Streptomyces sp. NBC_01618 TaxID=2975900 RepID=UPI00386995F3|nr:CDP-glycerol glycerophosphotransferase family protein [Streptomyces sp. NBC_01618]
MYRLLDALPVLAGDDRVTRLFTLVPGSDFGVDALSVIDAVGGRTLPWDEACRRTYDLILTASPKGELSLLRGNRVLLPHGAGFNKSIPGEGSADSASGLDPEYLLRARDAAPPALHALAHPDQVARLAAVSPRAAERAKVVGDPTLERVLASLPLRDRYRAALGTGPRKLLVLASTWGPECLLRRRPGLPAELAAHLPYDEYQLALIVHPNERSLLGRYELTERLAPALDAGLVLAAPYEEWASVLIAADALITDHGSTALYYCAALDRPVVSVHQGGVELIPGSPMDVLLRHIPELGPATAVGKALEAYRPGSGHAAARAAFAGRGEALGRLRTEVYALLGLAPPAACAPPRLLPSPAAATRTPAAFDVHAEIAADGVRIDRRPAGIGPPGHHLAVEHGAAGEQLTRSAGLLYCRPLPRTSAPQDAAWTAAGWTRHALSAYPGCRSAVAIPASGLCVLRVRGDERAYAVCVEPRSEDGRIVSTDPAAAVSAVHAWLSAHRGMPRDLVRPTCYIGDRAFRVLLRPATDDEAEQVL